MQNHFLVFLLLLSLLTQLTAPPMVSGSAHYSARNSASLLDDRDDGDFEFRGKIQTLPGAAGFVGDWTVSGRTVRVNAATEIKQEEGQVAVGAYVKVEGALQNDGSIIAREIEVENDLGGDMEYSFTGVVESLPNATDRIGDWTVSGVVVHVSAMTFLKQEKRMVAVGVKVEVEGKRRQDGSVDAFKIEVKSDFDAGQVNFQGVIESLPNTPGRIGQWAVSGRKVNVASGTKIEPDAVSVAIGNVVQVKGVLGVDGAIDAAAIEVKSDHGGGGLFVEFYGKVEALPGTPRQIGVWTVSGRKLNVDANTRIKFKGLDQAAGQVLVGSAVEVKGGLQTDGSINASRIKLKDREDEFFGRIESLPMNANLIGDWRVAGRTVRVMAATEIERKYGMVVVGAFVEVSGMAQPDGSIIAREIEVKQGDGRGAYMNYNPATTVSAAGYQDDNAPEAIVAAFGAKLSPSTAAASQLPLPTSLANVSVFVDGRMARLFVVSPAQINYQLPAGLAAGSASVVVTNSGQIVSQGTVEISSVAPSLFTANASGDGAPAGALLRIKANGQQSFEPLARFDAAQQKFVPAAIARNAGDQLILILFGTGLKQTPNTDGDGGNGSAENVSVTIGGDNAQVLFAGAAPGFAGLEQLNIRLPNDKAGAALTIVVKVRDGQNNQKQANNVSISLQ